MNTQTLSTTRSDTGLLPIAFALFLGAGLIFVAGFAHAHTIHDVAHDQRHAIAFPCH
ncbi:MAG: CbtB-domain containing protein [Rhodobacteraceae bacterium]|nr:CbtB-domain containing protein [Paracoccaceae bacterium]